MYVLEPPGHFFTSQAKPLWRDWSILITYRFLSLLGCKRVVLGLTLGPFEDAYAKFLGKTSGSYFQIGLRDRESLNLAEKYSFSNTTYIPDLAWYSQEEYAKMSQSLYVLLSFRDSVTGTRRDMPYFNALTDALDKVLPDLGKKILLFYQTVYDRNACLDIFDRYQDKHDIEFIDKCLSHTEASILYSGAELVISNRMHVLVPALKANTLIFSITDTQRHCKLRSVLYENDIPECFGDLSDQELREKLRLLQEDRENFLAKVKRIIAGNTAEINSIMNLIWP
ncbi:MAG: polysaccharide pyruvyl transferase family protein [Prolixibacteraceae bacterium]